MSSDRFGSNPTLSRTMCLPRTLHYLFHHNAIKEFVLPQHHSADITYWHGRKTGSILFARKVKLETYTLVHQCKSLPSFSRPTVTQTCVQTEEKQTRIVWCLPSVSFDQAELVAQGLKAQCKIPPLPLCEHQENRRFCHQLFKKGIKMSL